MPRLLTKVADYPVVEYYEDFFRPKVETVPEYLRRLEKTEFHEFDKTTKRGVKGWSKFDENLRNAIRESIRDKCIDKAGYVYKTETWKTGKFSVMRDTKGKFVTWRPIRERPFREKPRREIKRG